MNKFTDHDKQLVMDSAIALEYALNQAAQNGIEIGNALSHAQAILFELSKAGFEPSAE